MATGSSAWPLHPIFWLFPSHFLFFQTSTSVRSPSWPPSAWRTPSAATYRLITYANAKPVSKVTVNRNVSVSDLWNDDFWDEKKILTFVCNADVDECNRPDACGHKALCQNTAGNYTCSCPSGYGGNPYDGVSIPADGSPWNNKFSFFIFLFLDFFQFFFEYFKKISPNFHFWIF